MVVTRKEMNMAKEVKKKGVRVDLAPSIETGIGKEVKIGINIKTKIKIRRSNHDLEIIETEDPEVETDIVGLAETGKEIVVVIVIVTGEEVDQENAEIGTGIEIEIEIADEMKTEIDQEKKRKGRVQEIKKEIGIREIKVRIDLGEIEAGHLRVRDGEKKDDIES